MSNMLQPPPPTEEWWELYVQLPASLSDTVGTYLHDLGSRAVIFHEDVELAPPGDPCMIPSQASGNQVVLQGALLRDTSLPEQLVALQHVLSAYAQESPGIRLYCRPLPSMDYQTQWQQFFRPLYIGDRLCVRPPWDTTPVPAHLACLTLNPGPAFGTGTHPSTHLCLQLLTQLAPQYAGTSLLDVGCGSGILSLAALQLGWRQAVGVDIDPQAIPVAIQNATLNGLQTRVHYLQGSWNVVTGQFACITANIYLGPVIEMLQPLTRYLAPGGLLMLSGLLVSQEAALETALIKARLSLHSRLVEDGWLALAVQHMSPTR